MAEKGSVNVTNQATKLMQKFIILLALTFSIQAFAQKQTVEIEIPDDELPSERVFPKLDSPAAVLSRKLTFSRKIEVRLNVGWLLDDPFFQNQYFGIMGAYHLNETHGLGFKYKSWGSGISSYSKQLGQNPNNVEYSKAPGPKTSMSGVYEYNAFYGKVSFSQNKVYQFVLAGELEAGLMKYGSKSLPLFGIGGAQKFFFTKHFGAAIDLRLLYHQFLDPNSVVLRPGQPNYNPNPKESDFAEKFQISNELNLSVMYLF